MAVVYVYVFETVLLKVGILCHCSVVKLVQLVGLDFLGWVGKQHTTYALYVCVCVRVYVCVYCMYADPFENCSCKFSADSTDTAKGDHGSKNEGNLGLINTLDVRGRQLSG